MKTKSIAFLLMLFALITAFDCEDHTITEGDIRECYDGKIPDWVADMAYDLKGNGGKIIRYRYNDEYVYYVIECTNGCADFIDNVYNCKREVVCQFGGFTGLNTCPQFSNQATDSTLVWKD